MRTLSDSNPAVIFVYFISVAGIAMFCMNPVVTALSLFGAAAYFLFLNRKNGTSHLFFFALFVVMALINPLVSHNGVTVLFVMNDNPVTLESLVYGVVASAMVISVIYWFRSFSAIMSSDKLLYLFGSFSPKLALLLSMTLRYIPLFGAQTEKVTRAQKGMGLFRDDNAVDSFRAGTRIFSVMVTWALENGIVTADSMSARGYGTGKRTFFSLYRFTRHDALTLCTTLLLLALTVTGAALGALDFAFYPSCEEINVSPSAVMSYVSYALLCSLPSVIEIKEGLKWKYLRSKI